MPWNKNLELRRVEAIRKSKLSCAHRLADMLEITGDILYWHMFKRLLKLRSLRKN